MIPPIPVHLYATVAAVQQMSMRRAKKIDGDSSSEDTVETFNAVNPSMAVQAESGARMVSNRFRPLDASRNQEVVEDEEFKLLQLIANQFGIEEPQGLNAEQTAAYLKVIMFYGQKEYDIDAIEKDFGLNLIGISLLDFLDSIIDSESETAKRIHNSFADFLQKQDAKAAAFREEQKDAQFSEAYDEEIGIYSPFHEK